MAYEVEIKFRVKDHAALTSRLAELGFLAGMPKVQDDIYFRHPGRDFGDTDEAFRLRCDGESNYLTYKGPKQPGPTKTREEIEVSFADGPEARRELILLLERLGFRPLHEVRKTRLPFRLGFRGRPMIVSLDRVEDLGDFAEVEAIAVSEADKTEAQATVLELAEQLGLAEVERRSYLRMALERRGAGAG